MRAARMLVRGRRLAEEFMTDWCEAGEESTDQVLNETTGEYEPVFIVLYTGPCRFKAGRTAVGEIDAQGQQLVEQDSTVSFPLEASAMLSKNHVIHMMGSATDYALVGVKARIQGPAVSSYMTARRFSVEVTT